MSTEKEEVKDYIIDIDSIIDISKIDIEILKQAYVDLRIVKSKSKYYEE